MGPVRFGAARRRSRREEILVCAMRWERVQHLHDALRDRHVPLASGLRADQSCIRRVLQVDSIPPQRQDLAFPHRRCPGEHKEGAHLTVTRSLVPERPELLRGYEAVTAIVGELCEGDGIERARREVLRIATSVLRFARMASATLADRCFVLSRTSVPCSSWYRMYAMPSRKYTPLVQDLPLIVRGPSVAAASEAAGFWKNGFRTSGPAAAVEYTERDPRASSVRDRDRG